MESGYTTVPLDEHHRLLRKVWTMREALEAIRDRAYHDVDERTASGQVWLQPALVLDLCQRALQE